MMYRLGLLLIAMFISAEGIKAQPCDFLLEICKEFDTQIPGVDESCLPPGCFRYYYHVYLKANQSQQYIQFEELGITTELQLQGQLSHFNPEATLGCLNSQFADYLVSPTETTVGFYMPDESGSYYFPQNPILLFTIVVDAFPGETIDVAVGGTITYVSGTTTVTCAPGIDATCTLTQSSTEVTWQEPAACSGESISFGQVQGGGNDPAVIPVYLNNATGSIEEMDVKIRVTFDNFMSMPIIIGGDIPAQDVAVFDNNGNGYIIYASVRNITNPSGQLFRIQIDGPLFQSSGGTATLTLENARYEPLNGSCCKPGLGSSVQAVFSGFSDCVEDIIVRIDAETGLDCDDLEMKVTLNWTEPLNSRDFYKIVVDVELDVEGDVSVVGLKTSDIACPVNQSYCGGTTCFQKLSDQRFLFCLWAVSPVTVLNETGFTVDILASAGCINGVTIRQAYLDLTGGGSGVACVPQRFIDEEAFPLCNPLLSGTIARENNEYVQGSYDINITSGSCNYTLTPACQKLYAKCVCSAHETYTVAPFKNNNWICGVSTFDLVLITKHILKVELLDSPYKIIAADANKSGGVTTFDVVVLKKLILNITEEISNNTSWRFIDATYQFPNPLEPLEPPFPEFVEASSFPATADFVAIKVGDVNLSCAANCFAGPAEPELRSAERLHLGVPTLGAKAGQPVLVPFYWNDGLEIDGLQLDLRFDPEVLAFEEVVSAGAAIGSGAFGLTEASSGRLLLSWVAQLEPLPFVGKESLSGRPLFVLRFRSRREVDNVLNVLRLEDGWLRSEAYGTDGTHYDLQLGTSAPEVGGDFGATLRPNPFADELIFDIHSELEGPATLSLYDSRGVRVWHRRLDLKPGSNEQRIEDSATLPHGVLLWKLRRRGAVASGYVIHQ